MKTINLLIVDDDHDLLEMLMAHLAISGKDYDLISLSDPEEALSTLKTTEMVDILVTDLNLPGMRGDELVRQAKRIFPQIRVLFITGIRDHSDLHPLGRVLEKPFTASTLMEELGSFEQEIHREHAAGQGAKPRILEGSADAPPLLEPIDGFTGLLKGFRLYDVIQTFCLAHRTGRLDFSIGDATATIYLKNGRPIHAECEGLEGEKAVHRLFAWQRGSFAFMNGVLPTTATVSTTWEHLVLEGTRQLEEAETQTATG